MKLPLKRIYQSEDIRVEREKFRIEGRELTSFKIGRQEIEAIIERIQFIRNQKNGKKARREKKKIKRGHCLFFFRIYGIVEISQILTDVLPKHLCSSSDNFFWDLSMR